MGALFLVVGAGLAAYFFLGASAADTPRAAARAIVAECSGERGDRSPCYERLVPELYPRFDVPTLFETVRTVRMLDPSYRFCHVLAHKIGERVVATDPSGWLEAMRLNPPDGLCSNGFIHGVIGGQFGSEVLSAAQIEALLPDFSRACEPRDGWTPTGLDRGTCYHGMGHLFDFITDADIPQALALCGKTVPEDYRRVCVQGVFMQIYQPLEPDDDALIERMAVKPTPGTVRDYCARYADDPVAEGSCIVESWPFEQPRIKDGTAVPTLCSWTPNAEERNMCYVALASIVGRMSLGDPDGAVRACDAFPESERGSCFAHSAMAVLEESRTDAGNAVDVCKRASPDIAARCLDALVDDARFIFGTDKIQFEGLCAALAGAPKGRCLRALAAAGAPPVYVP
jgi:hypothetical protein